MDEIIVLDYMLGEVYLYTLPRHNMSNEDIEDWLESMGYNQNDTNWMSHRKIIINDERD